MNLRQKLISLRDLWPWPLWALVLMGALLRAYRLGSQSLWMDEVRQVSMYFDSENIFHLIHGAAGQQQPPLDYIIGWAIGLFLPFHEVTARLPAFLFGVALIPTTYLLAKKISNRFGGLIAASWVTFFPPLIEYSQEARPYSIFFVLFLLFLYAGTNAQKWARGLQIFFWVTFALLLSRGFEPLVTLISFGLVLTITTYALGLMPPTHWRQLAKQTIKAGLWFLPFLAFVVGRSKKYLAIEAEHPLNRMNVFSLDPILDPFQNAWPQLFGDSGLVFFISLVVISFTTSIRMNQSAERSANYIFLFLMLVTTYVLHTYLFYGLVNGFFAGLSSKYLIYLIPLAFILLASGLANLVEIAPEKLRQNLRAITFAFSIVLLALFAKNLPQVYAKEKADYRSLGQWIDSTAKYGDVILKESFVPHRMWESEVWGEGLYFKKPLPKLLIQDLADKILNQPTSTAKVLVILQGIPSSIEFNRSIFSHCRWSGIDALELVSSRGNWRDDLLVILTELLKVYPDTDARAALHIARARLICESDWTSAQADLHSAASYLNDEKIKDICPN